MQKYESYCRLAELQKSLAASGEELVAAKREQSAEIARLEAIHAARISEKDESESKVKTLLVESEADKEEKMAELNRVQQARLHGSQHVNVTLNPGENVCSNLVHATQYGSGNSAGTDDS